VGSARAKKRSQPNVDGRVCALAELHAAADRWNTAQMRQHQHGKSMHDITKQRRTFEKALLGALGPAVKDMGWKKSGQILFRESNGFFEEIEISVFLNDEKIRVTHKIKPMTLDLILWDILQMPENASKPLSFRSNGAFTCGGLSVHEALLDTQYVTLDDAVTALRTIADNSHERVQAALAETGFSTLLAQHPHQRERGAYAVTLVTSLINDGDRRAAAELAGAYASGKIMSCMNLSCDGISFHRLALDWLQGIN
jgi:hypothetical protein